MVFSKNLAIPFVRGIFISIEGTEGAGKSSVVKGLSEFLESLGQTVVCTREPGGTALGEEVRKVILTKEETSSTAEMLLFAADRAEHVEKLIQPALKNRKSVICDRFIHSTLAYQGYGRGLDLKELRQLNQLATKGLKPDLVLLLDLEPELGLARARTRAESEETAESWSRFEAEKLEFHNKIRNGFLELAKIESENIRIIDASQSVEQVLEAVIKTVEKFLTDK